MTRFKLRITHGLSHHPDIIKETTNPRQALRFLEREVSPYTCSFTKIITTDNKQYVKSVAEDDSQAFRDDYVPDNQFVVWWQRVWGFISNKSK
ncbi:hypothetical protein C0Z01_19560 [Photobacterium kishitanii]|uniref:Uncharacterized protein n=1 Tax=Photobacterium kishitanii TaxID=318456 RepID=A0A2T3KB50_9GAMM|nr:hypothetical protein [Photobacterium kishitanii]KJG08550.1 hypothetical protein UB40_17450 [Photobacterium kishitanii]KJG55847.1 hypothetical protein UA38_17590 [Photobacterium kishitanii]KJG58864.1 hypothetical protein UA42_19010 [Photobacterium kishitanii]KJG64001.1 hypothetical protein UA40_19015 [Photobacterium kishitanii]KJG68152.1 hypothetical protein UA41_18605 [Photobacterium kishitanii]